MGSTLKILATQRGLTSAVAGATFDLTPTSASSKAWLIKSIFFYNYGAAGADIVVDLKVKQASTYRMLLKGLTISGGAAASKGPMVLEKEITLDLNTPDVLAAVLSVPGTTTTPTMDCVINGIEKDQ